MSSIENEKAFWRRQRVLWPATGLLLSLGALLLALIQSNRSQVIVYNETGETIPELIITACGQSKTFREVEDASSPCFNLAPTGAESDVIISTNSASKPLWQGEYIEPKGGYETIVHLRPGAIEASTTVSWWQKTFFNRQ